LRIAGGDVKLMLDMHCHAFEPFAEVSYFLIMCALTITPHTAHRTLHTLLRKTLINCDQCESTLFPTRCGGAGSGKSMRAKRMQALLPEGWIKGSGSSSAKVGHSA